MLNELVRDIISIQLVHEKRRKKCGGDDETHPSTCHALVYALHIVIRFCYMTRKP
jgi:hypothetical protein